MIKMGNMETEMTTVRLSKRSVDFIKSEGKYGESLADIADRLFEELKKCRGDSPHS